LLATAALLAGCGGDDEPATTVPVVGGAATTPTQTPETTTTTAKRDPMTVKGALGDTLELVGQPSYDKPSKVKVKVTVKRLIGPFSGFNLDAGRKLIGLEVRFSNVGTAKFDDPLPGGRLAVSGGESGKQTSLISTGKKSPCDNPSIKLAPGQSKDVCIAYDIPKDGKPETFEYGVDSGYGDTGLWRLR
jgi:hypothetical protein